MRKYPKKCFKCNEYMEPVFTESAIGNHTARDSKPSLMQEPQYWKCGNIECEEYGKKQEEEQ